jgi:hypothetical protein
MQALAAFPFDGAALHAHILGSISDASMSLTWRGVLSRTHVAIAGVVWRLPGNGHVAIHHHRRRGCFGGRGRIFATLRTVAREVLDDAFWRQQLPVEYRTAPCATNAARSMA